LLRDDEVMIEGVFPQNQIPQNIPMRHKEGLILMTSQRLIDDMFYLEKIFSSFFLNSESFSPALSSLQMFLSFF